MAVATAAASEVAASEVAVAVAACVAQVAEGTGSGAYSSAIQRLEEILRPDWRGIQED